MKKERKRRPRPLPAAVAIAVLIAFGAAPSAASAPADGAAPALEAVAVVRAASDLEAASAFGPAPAAAGEACVSPAEVRLITDTQKVWIDHTIWTRSYIVSAMTNRPDRQDVLDRLLRNQQDIGDVFKPYYGEAAGNRLAELLREHIVIAGAIVEAAAKGNERDMVRLQTEWRRYADAIAAFLNGLNPNRNRKTLEDMLHTHLRLISGIVVACLKGDWKEDIRLTDENEIHMIKLADFLTDGIVKQFPEKF